MILTLCTRMSISDLQKSTVTNKNKKKNKCTLMRNVEDNASSKLVQCF